jgi:hypothetical protein
MPSLARGFSFAAVLGLAACALPVRGPPRRPSPTEIKVDVRVASTSPWVLAVEETIVGGAEVLIGEEKEGVESVTVVDASAERPLARRGGQWVVGCPATCRVRYRYDLTRAAEMSGDAFDVAVRSGGDIIAPAWTWLLRPEPLHPQVPIDVVVHTEAPVTFAAGLDAGGEPGHFTLLSQELSAAGYTAFGTFTRRRIQATGGVVDVAILDGPRRADDALLARWVRDAAASLDAVFGKFPVARAQLFIVPSAGSHDVDFGRTLPSGGASIALLVGSEADEAELDDDWILTHELFHLGVPSFWNEGRWLDEGLATYYEPVVRARAGVLTERDLWRELARGMPRGLPGPRGTSLVDVKGGARAYWGGAMFVLRADVEIRRRSGGERSLDDGLRAVLSRGGDATRIWTVEHFLKAIDEAVNLPVMGELYACAARPVAMAAPMPADPSRRCPPTSRPELETLLDELGVGWSRETGLSLGDDAPLSVVRRQITHPASLHGQPTLSPRQRRTTR